MTTIKHYEINGCRLFEAKDLIERTGITVTNSSVVTRMLARYAPYSQTAKEWREAGADIPDTVRDNKKLLTEQQAARYLSHIPHYACPELHKMFKEVKEFFDPEENGRSFECTGLVFDYDTGHRDLMDELFVDKEYLFKMDQALECPGMILDFPVEVDILHRNVPEWIYTTKFEVPFFDSVKKVAHFYITTEQMTRWVGAQYYGEGTIEVQSKEYEELKKVAVAVSLKLDCEYHIHVITKKDSTPVTQRDHSYYFEAKLIKDEMPF